MKNAKVRQVETPNFLIDHRSGQLKIFNATGPCRLAVIDSDGNLLLCDNIEEIVADAALDALFETIGPVLDAHSRRLMPPPR